MASELTDGFPDSGVDGTAVATARVRAVATTVLTLAAILMLAGSLWLQTAARFDTARIRTEAETVRNAMAGMLAMGLPLRDFIGFDAVSARIFHANPSVQAIVVRDRTGEIVLANPTRFPDAVKLPVPSIPDPADAASLAIDSVERYSRLAIPIVNRFGPAGSLELMFERAPLHDLTRRAAVAGVAAVAVLAIGLAVHGLAIANPEFFQSRRDLLGSYLLATMLGLGLSLAALAGLAAEKAAETAGAYAYSLGARLGEAVALGISPEDLSGLDEVVREYRESNSVIGYVALLEGNRIATATGLPEGLLHWEQPAGYFDAVYEVRPRRLYTPQYRVAVGIPWRVAARELAASATLPAGLAAAAFVLGIVVMVRLRVQERR